MAESEGKLVESALLTLYTNAKEQHLAKQIWSNVESSLPKSGVHTCDYIQ